MQVHNLRVLLDFLCEIYFLSLMLMESFKVPILLKSSFFVVYILGALLLQNPKTIIPECSQNFDSDSFLELSSKAFTIALRILHLPQSYFIHTFNPYLLSA